MFILQHTSGTRLCNDPSDLCLVGKTSMKYSDILLRKNHRIESSAIQETFI